MKLKFLSILCLVLIATTSCDDSTSNEFMDANPDAVARYIKTITIVSAQNNEEDTTITINYDANNRVSSITDGTETSLLVYENDQLANVTEGGETMNVEDLYESPYDAFETGEVINYDNNGNPQNLRFYETEYDWETNSDVTTEYRAEIIYDAKPNPYFYTLQAAGAIHVMDNVDLNFDMNGVADIVQARMLFPLNNITKINYRDLDGNLLSDVTADFVYNSDNYPTSATVTGVNYDDIEGDETSIYSITYTYRPSN